MTTDAIRVLVVEDNLLLAEVLGQILEDFGCEVLGPVPSVESGLRMAGEASLDGAILDINLRGEVCFPIAETLAGRRVPYMFLTGYDNSRLIPPEHRAAPRLVKPVDPAGLAAAVREAFRPPSVH